MSLKEIPKDLFDKINNAIDGLNIKPSIDIADIDDQIVIDFYINKDYILAQALYLFREKDNINKRLFIKILDKSLLIDDKRFFGEICTHDNNGWSDNVEDIRDENDYLEYFSFFEKRLMNKLRELKENFYANDDFIYEIANNILDKKLEDYAKQLDIDYNKIAKVLVDILDKNIKANLLK